MCSDSRSSRKARAALVTAFCLSLASFSLAGSAAAASDCSAFATPPYFARAVPPPPAPGSSRGLTYEQINEYLSDLDKASDRVVTGVAGKSVEGRELMYAIVGREGKVTARALAALRSAAQDLMNPDTPAAVAELLAGSTPLILWVSGNLHGNEESGADAALRVLHELAARDDCAAGTILDNAVVVFLPAQNPDGREANTRRNAYGFDLNQDGFARTQPETDGRLELMRLYPPMLAIDAHEMGSQNYFFPPTVAPTYHELPTRAFGWVGRIYGPALATEFERQKMSYFNGAPYDLFAVEYGDTVPAVGFHAAGMTFEKYNGAAIAERSHAHYVAMWTALFAGAGQRTAIVGEWRKSFTEAREQGLAGTLAAPPEYYAVRKPYKTVPGMVVRHYFLRNDPARSRELARLIRRLQRMDVQVWQLTGNLAVSDYRAYRGAGPGSITLPRGTYWIPLAQRQKHWIQAMLNEDTYVSVSTSYDVTAWSNPLLMNLDGGYSGKDLFPDAKLVAALAEPAPPVPSGSLPRIGLFEIPGGASGFVAAGSIRYLFDRVWQLPYTPVTAENIRNDGLVRLGIQVLLVPDGYANAGKQALGNQGLKAIADWVSKAGGRYVGYGGGSELAVAAGVSTAILKSSSTSAYGTLIRARLKACSPLAAGIPALPPDCSADPNATTPLWLMYADDEIMSPGLGNTAAFFPAGDLVGETSGQSIGVDELRGSAAIIDEPIGTGRSIVFSFDPNFRAWTDGTQRILWNALFAQYPSAGVLAAELGSAAVARARQAASQLPDVGKAIRITVRPEDADATRLLLVKYGAEFKELRKPERTVFMIENRKGLSREEHPFAMDLTRELRRQITPISFSMP